jgi:hypothetical protein
VGIFLDVSDLPENAGDSVGISVDQMIEDAEAMATLAAPCITADGFAYEAAVRAILRQAILRWSDSGSGALQSRTTGPFGEVYDNRQERRGMFWPNELVALQNLCSTNQGGVYTVSMAGPDPDPSDSIPLA